MAVLAFIVGACVAVTPPSASPSVSTAVVGNTDLTAEVSDSVTTRDDPYLEPFATAVGSGVPFVMVALATYELIDPAHLAAFSPTVLDGMLRGDLRFDGVVISDDLGATAAVASIPPGTRAIDFLDAGGDMIIATTTRRSISSMPRRRRGSCPAGPSKGRGVGRRPATIARPKGTE